jgi:hypothetical protein
MPKAESVATQVTFPDGSRLVHASLSLHSGTPAAWFDALVSDWGSPEWLLVGVDHGHGEAVIERVAALQSNHVLVTDLLTEMRKQLGFPTELLTPVRDRMVADGVLADVLVSGAGLRYE